MEVRPPLLRERQRPFSHRVAGCIGDAVHHLEVADYRGRIDESIRAKPLLPCVVANGGGRAIRIEHLRDGSDHHARSPDDVAALGASLDRSARTDPACVVQPFRAYVSSQERR